MNDGGGVKKAKGTSKCIIKQILKFEDYRKCFENNRLLLRSQKSSKAIQIVCFLKNFTRLH